MDLEQASDRLTAIPSRMLKLRAQLARRPWRHAPPVPAVEERERLVIIERKPSHETTAHPEGVRVPMLTRDRGAYPPHIPTRAFETAGGRIGLHGEDITEPDSRGAENRPRVPRSISV